MNHVRQPTSTLADLIRLVTAALNGAGDGIEVMVGRQYLAQFGAGSPPRLLFVPEERGRLGPPPKINANYVGSYTHGCKVYVRGAESGDDPGRFDAVYAFADRVVNAIKWAGGAAGTIAPGNPLDSSPRAEDAYGADIVFEFTYTRAIARDPEIWGVPVTAISPPDPDRPQGSSGKTIDVTTSAEPVEE